GNTQSAHSKFLSSSSATAVTHTLYLHHALPISPARKKAKVVTRYMMPSCLWSVVRNNRSRVDPFTGFRVGYGRVAIGWGATAVTEASCTRNPANLAVATGGDPRWLREIVSLTLLIPTHWEYQITSPLLR